MSGLRGLDYHLAGFDRLGRPGQLVVANHPSLIDVVFLIAFVPGAGCVVKSALWRNPAMALMVRSAGYVPNHPTDSMIEGAAAALADGQTVIMFPEGTRTRPGLPLRFHRGAASVAARAARTVTPVFITVKPTTLTKHEPWYRIPPRRPHFCLRVGEDLDLAADRAVAPLPQASRAINGRLEAIYASEVVAY
jgi:1-acyl-sn-glycerol-3-phosphate acyltransferase